ncbi:MAG TPA: GNAT family N-acetyltransferase, partial [bacterium]|nr:GNAT family N-acetyltransferase [bacterium]
MTDEITVGMAVTDAQKQGIYHLRYQVYVEDLCLMPEFADHQQKTLAEPIDAHAKLFFAEAGGEIVGTMRINLGLDGPLEHESLYDLHKFVPYFPTCVAMCTKFAVARKKRGSEVARRLIQDAYVYLRERGILFVFIDCWPHLLNLYEHLGFRRYRSNIRHPEAGYMTPMVFVFDDVAHFELINSPLAPVAKQFPD